MKYKTEELALRIWSHSFSGPTEKKVSFQDTFTVSCVATKRASLFNDWDLREKSNISDWKNKVLALATIILSEEKMREVSGQFQVIRCHEERINNSVESFYVTNLFTNLERKPRRGKKAANLEEYFVWQKGRDITSHSVTPRHTF